MASLNFLPIPIRSSISMRAQPFSIVDFPLLDLFFFLLLLLHAVVVGLNKIKNPSLQSALFSAAGITMDFAAGCFGDSAVAVAGSSSSSSGGSSGQQQPLQNTVSCFYRTTLSTKKEVLVKVTWHRTGRDSFTTVVLGDAGLSPSAPFGPEGSKSQLLRKSGRCSFFFANSMFVLHWDFSTAKYAGAGPEPAKDFYLVLLADAELALLLGDKCRDFLRKFPHKAPLAATSMYCRAEEVVGGAAAHSTRARFTDAGREHDVTVTCRGDERDTRNGELCVSIDRRRVVRVKSLRWNFRGSQTVVVDGAAVDVLWDAHDWWFREASGGATFALRVRGAAPDQPGRLRPDEELERAAAHFILLIQVFRSLSQEDERPTR